MGESRLGRFLCCSLYNTGYHLWGATVQICSDLCVAIASACKLESLESSDGDDLPAGTLFQKKRGGGSCST